MMKILYDTDNVVLQVKNLQLPADISYELNILDILLMQCYFLQIGEHPLIVLCPLRAYNTVFR